MTQISTVTVTAGAPDEAPGAVGSRVSVTGPDAVFDPTKLAAGVERILTDQAPAGYGITGVRTVVCPAQQPVTKGTSFACSATIDGAVRSVPVVVTGDEKDPAERGSYQVGVPQ